MFNEFGVSVFDKRGRCVWEMPKPTSIVMHRRRGFSGKGKTKVVTAFMDEVPVYRGFDASLVRNTMSALRRINRKKAERDAAQQRKSAKVEIPDDLIEELTDA